MAFTITYKKFNVMPVTVTWFNTESTMKEKFIGLRIFRQSVPIDWSGHGVCINEYSSVTSIIDLKQSEEDLWQQLDPKSCRYEIRKIRKMVDAGEKIVVSDKGNPESFLKLANSYIAERNYTKPLKRWQIDMYLGTDRGEIFSVNYNDKLVGCNFYIKDYPERIRLLYSFNNRLSDASVGKLSGAFMRYMHWQAMEKYKKEGYTGYDMGGVGTNSEETRRIAEFKLSFGGSVVEEKNYIYVSNQLVGLVYKKFRDISSSRYHKKRALSEVKGQNK